MSMDRTRSLLPRQSMQRGYNWSSNDHQIEQVDGEAMKWDPEARRKLRMEDSIFALSLEASNLVTKAQ